MSAIAPPPGRFDDNGQDAAEGRLPPCDMDAEGLVLAHVMLTGSIETVCGHILAADFFSEANQLIYRACVDITVSDQSIDAVSVRRRLSDLGQLDRIGGASYLLQIIQKTPATAYIVDHAKVIAAKARVRRMIDAAERIRILGHSANGSSTEYLAAALESVRLIVDDDRTAAENPFAWIDSPTILAPMPPAVWVVPGLCIGPGRPTLLTGYGFSGKTIAVQALDMAIAAGLKAWGEYRCEAGRVLHIDLEQGERATRRRFARLAFASQITESDLDGRLRLSSFPRVYLTTEGIETILCRECEGVALCSIDSFRAAIPGLDENSSDVRVVLDTLTRVSERTGTAFVVLHHEGKDAQGPDQRDRRQKARGSSAIFDAAGTVISLSASAPYEPVKVSFRKVSASAEGLHAAEFFLKFEDCPDDEGRDDRAGLRVVHMLADQVAQSTSPAEAMRATSEAIVRYLRDHPRSTGRSIAEGTAGRRSTVLAAIDQLEIAGRITGDKAPGRSGGGGTVWSLSTVSSETGK